MGIAASQARFLCITARKSDCEYKSTELAQQKLEITQQLSDVSTEYSNAMNSTKLTWSNDAVDGDYDVTYSLLMTPSAANDYNPYMITTTSGAVVLNSEYAAAAKAAGISKAGGSSSSQDGKNKFVSALVPLGVITQDTAKDITTNTYLATKDATTNQVTLGSSIGTNATAPAYNYSAGVGSNPLDKSSVASMDLSSLILSDSIGKKVIDWTQLVLKSGYVSDIEYQAKLDNFDSKIADARTASDVDTIFPQLTTDEPTAPSGWSDSYYVTLSEKVVTATTATAKATAQEELNNFWKTNKNVSFERQYQALSNAVTSASSDSDKATAQAALNNFTDNHPVNYLIYQKNQYVSTYGSHVETFDNACTQGNFQIKENSILDGGDGYYTIVQNAVINHYKDELKEITVGDLLSGDVVLMTQDSSDGAKKNITSAADKLLNYIAGIFGYNNSGYGLNVDSASNAALNYAMTMTEDIYLKANNAITTGSRGSDSALTDNSAYLNANEYNRASVCDGYSAVNLSNMLSAFLTYYDNYLSGTSSPYIVGKSQSTSNLITDDNSYKYVGQDDDNAPTLTEKISDFYDELYNNICEHGWREDDSLDDNEYLESAIKDGRYSMSSLNKDGYYYQTRYNETGYMKEVSDSDAIAVAEAEYTRKKSELTYKEDSIDLKSKKLDAEISTLSTEYETVKSLISKSVEKTFTMFAS